MFNFRVGIPETENPRSKMSSKVKSTRLHGQVTLIAMFRRWEFCLCAYEKRCFQFSVGFSAPFNGLRAGVQIG
jgi:hypothetical protein